MEQQFALAWTTSLLVLRLEYNKLPFVWREILNFLEVRPIFATEIQKMEAGAEVPARSDFELPRAL
jgi:hypothetical protein